MKTVRDGCELQPSALSIRLSDQIEQLDELIIAEGDGEAFFEKTHLLVAFGLRAKHPKLRKKYRPGEHALPTKHQQRKQRRWKRTAARLLFTSSSRLKTKWNCSIAAVAVSSGLRTFLPSIQRML